MVNLVNVNVHYQVIRVQINEY